MFGVFPAGALGVFVMTTFVVYWCVLTFFRQQSILSSSRIHPGGPLSDEERLMIQKQGKRLSSWRRYSLIGLYVLKFGLIIATVFVGQQVGGLPLNDIYMTVAAVVLWCDIFASWPPQCLRCRVKLGYCEEFPHVAECPCCGVSFERLPNDGDDKVAKLPELISSA